MISLRRGGLRAALCAALVALAVPLGLVGCAHGSAARGGGSEPGPAMGPKPLVVVRAIAPATLDP